MIFKPFAFFGNLGIYQGKTFGYIVGMLLTSLGSTNRTEKYSFVSDGNASDVNDLSSFRLEMGGCHSEIKGYVLGGNTTGFGWSVSTTPAASGNPTNSVEKTTFSTDSAFADANDLSGSYLATTGHTDAKNGFGYSSGGKGSGDSACINIIQKFPFSTEANLSNVNTLNTNSGFGCPLNSANHGYTCIGRTGLGSGYYGDDASIDKFDFGTDSSCTDIGNATVNAFSHGGASSHSRGYHMGGSDTVRGLVVDIAYVDFSTDAGSTDTADLTVARTAGAGGSSNEYGYLAGGWVSGGPTNVIDKFDFATESNATDVGDLSAAGSSTCGFHV